MKEQDLLTEENKLDRKVFRTLRKRILIFFTSLLFFMYFLHYFGSWSMNRTESTNTYSEVSNWKVNYFYTNKCVLFNNSHTGEVYESEQDYKKNYSSSFWVILNSFRFTFTGHILIWIIFGGVILILYAFTDTKQKKGIS